jgi:diguanylate cyclase (GGDEF)-like protein
MPAWLQSALKACFVPGGFILGGAFLFLGKSRVSLSPASVDFFYYAVFVAALALALRFHCLRIVFAALVLLLGHFALHASQHAVGSQGAKTAFEVVALLLPLDFILLTFMPERTLSRQDMIGIASVLFFESTFVAVFSRPEQPAFALFHLSILRGYHLRLPQSAALVFIIALSSGLVRLLRFRKATEHGMFWALLAAGLGLEAGAAGRVSTAYFGIAGLMLASSVIENSYSLAYRDELTGLHSRRAFNDALLRLNPPYAVAVVDIDHFKHINDAHGHDTGDQVLRLVASRLAGVTGGGHPFRVGGEEFNLLFPGRNTKEVFDHLELLRMNIESCSFRFRKGEDRRKTPRDNDRRLATRKSKSFLHAVPGALSVTVSIGVADSHAGNNVEQVIAQADKALYAAKQSGRNRIEVATSERKKRKRGPRLHKPTSNSSD